MRGLGPERDDRKYLGYVAQNVPNWYKDTWAICREPTDEELSSFDANSGVGPGGRLEAICEIDADGDVLKEVGLRLFLIWDDTQILSKLC